MNAFVIALALVTLLAPSVSAQPAPVRSVAVFEFADQTAQGFTAGQIGATLLSSALAARYRVAAPAQAAAALQASGLRPDDLTRAAAADLGRRLGVDAVVVGRFVRLDVGPLRDPIPTPAGVRPGFGEQLAMVTIRLEAIESATGRLLRRGEVNGLAVGPSRLVALRRALQQAAGEAASSF